MGNTVDWSSRASWLFFVVLPLALTIFGTYVVRGFDAVLKRGGHLTKKLRRDRDIEDIMFRIDPDFRSVETARAREIQIQAIVIVMVCVIAFFSPQIQRTARADLSGYLLVAFRGIIGIGFSLGFVVYQSATVRLTRINQIRRTTLREQFAELRAAATQELVESERQSLDVSKDAVARFEGEINGGTF